MTGFKAATKAPLIRPASMALRRVSWLGRTVRYEWPGVDEEGKSVTYYSPTFTATSQEWERAHE